MPHKDPERRRAHNQAYMRAYREAGREKIDPERRRAYNQVYMPAYWEANREHRLAQMKVWRKANVEKGRAYAKTRRATPEGRIEHNLRCRVRSVMKGKGTKSARTMELLGCSVEHLRAHLEHLFQPGMSWDNFGTWHVDHIRPCASFDLTDPAQQRQCFHWLNLQPLWADDNRSKKAKPPTEAELIAIGNAIFSP